MYQRGEIWVQETFRLRIGDGIFHTDLAIRSEDWFNDFNRYHIRIGGGYRFDDKWNILGMAGYVYTNSNLNKIHDIRVNFDANYRQNIFKSRVIFNYRFRQEYRRIYGLEGLPNSLRMRNRFGITIPINHTALEENTWYFKFEDEIFFELLQWNPNFLDQNRIVTSFGWALNTGITFELSYCWQMDFLLEDQIILGDHIIWLKFSQTIMKAKKKIKSKETSDL